jgi:hypothetical protein
MGCLPAPVANAAKNPAVLLRGARGSPSMGIWAGKGGVYLPKARPTVDAAVSAHDRLLVVQVSWVLRKKPIPPQGLHQNANHG